MPTTEIEVHVMVDENGDFVVACDPDELIELFQQTHGGSTPVTNVYSIQLTVPTPAARIVQASVVPDDGPVRLNLKRT